MRGFVAPTDHGWYRYLRARPELEEVNFWRPGTARFAALRPGEPFFFKLKAPYNAIGGFGQFARFASLPLWMAWDVFGDGNGVANMEQLRQRLEHLSSRTPPLSVDTEIGSISIAFPTFFAPDEWVDVPPDWQRNIVSGRTYDLTDGVGGSLWEECVKRAVSAAGAKERVHGRGGCGAQVREATADPSAPRARELSAGGARRVRTGMCRDDRALPPSPRRSAHPPVQSRRNARDPYFKGIAPGSKP